MTLDEDQNISRYLCNLKFVETNKLSENML